MARRTKRHGGSGTADGTGGEAADASLPPIGIDPGRHRDLTGRRPTNWGRRGIVLVLVLIMALGLANVFGQCSRVTTVSGAGAALVVDSPPRVRGGLVFTTDIVVTPERALRNVRIFLGRGWFQGMSVNTIEPSPVSQTSDGQWVVFAFGPLKPGHAFHLWLSLQTNPTNVGGHAQEVELYDGATRLAVVHRSLFVFP